MILSEILELSISYFGYLSKVSCKRGCLIFGITGKVFFIEVGILDLPTIFETSELILTVNGLRDNLGVDCILMALSKLPEASLVDEKMLDLEA